MQKTVKKVAVSQEQKRSPVGEAGKRLKKEKLSPSWSAAGFLLMNSSLYPVSFNTEAIGILGYPDKFTNLTSPDEALGLTGKIRTSLMRWQRSGESTFVTEFHSGRRRYSCRAFLLDGHTKDPSQPSIAVLLERTPSGLIPLLQVSQQFNLTRREGEALTYLVQGLSSKEIANRMNISPSTVKAFLRLIMIKTGVSSRSAIVARIMMTQTARSQGLGSVGQQA